MYCRSYKLWRRIMRWGQWGIKHVLGANIIEVLPVGERDDGRLQLAEVQVSEDRLVVGWEKEIRLGDWGESVFGRLSFLQKSRCAAWEYFLIPAIIRFAAEGDGKKYICTSMSSACQLCLFLSQLSFCNVYPCSHHQCNILYIQLVQNVDIWVQEIEPYNACFERSAAAANCLLNII